MSDQTIQNTQPDDAGPAEGFVRVRVVYGYQLVDERGEKVHRLAGAVIDVPEDEAAVEAHQNRVQIVDPATPLADPTYPTTNPPQVE